MPLVPILLVQRPPTPTLGSQEWPMDPFGTNVSFTWTNTTKWSNVGKYIYIYRCHKSTGSNLWIILHMDPMGVVNSFRSLDLRFVSLMVGTSFIISTSYPIPSCMVYLHIFTYIWLIFTVNVGKYTIHACCECGDWMMIHPIATFVSKRTRTKNHWSIDGDFNLVVTSWRSKKSSWKMKNPEFIH